jgi:signal transduction histidine kinase
VRWLSEPARAWKAEMNAADRTRVLLGWGFVFGCVSHFGWLWVNGSLLYHGPAPPWAVWFWFGVCAVDLVVFWLMLAHPRAGIVLGVATMMTTLTVNWTQFPTFEYTFNWVLIGLTLFGVIMFATAPWLWRASRWKLSRTS